MKSENAEGGSSSPLLDVKVAAKPHYFSIARRSGRSTFSREGACATQKNGI
jgi:hypothetical protein